MAAAAGEDALRQLSPFLARAEEVASIDPRVAYYLRLYAWKRGQASSSGYLRQIAGICTFSQ